MLCTNPLLFSLQDSSEVDDKTEINRGLRIKVQTFSPLLIVTEQLKFNRSDLKEKTKN